MNSRELILKVSNSKLENYPFPHFVVEEALGKSDLQNIISDLEMLEKSEPTSLFNSDFGQKKEWKSFPESLINLNEILETLGSNEFIEALKVKFQIRPEINVLPDFSYDGGGYVISPPGSFLGYHADFNFSSKANMYRVLNVLLYMNSEYSASDGGELHLLDVNSKTVEKRVSPKLGTLLAFFTDDTSFHGVSKNNLNFYRKSFNLYYYCSTPISPNQASDPHRTIWIDTNSHTH
jgi:hypothetical protein